VTKTATLFISLADGTCTTFSGDITQVAMLRSEGGLARYRVRLTPRLWRLTQVRNSRVWHLDKVHAVNSATKNIVDYLTRNYEEYLK